MAHRQWFDELAGRLMPFGQAQGDWIVHAVRAGPVRFDVIADARSGFADIVRAFYAATELDRPEPGVFQVWCLDGRHPRTLPGLHLSGAGVRACFEAARQGGAHQLLLPDPARGLITAFDASRGLGVFHAEDCARLPSWERYSPLKSFVHLLALQAGAWLAHGGSVADARGRGVLLAGPGGSGKSTTTLNLLRQGLNSAGDDYAVLAPGEGACQVHAVYRTLKLHPSAPLAIGPGLDGEPWEVDATTGKQVLLANRAGEVGRLVPGFRLSAIAGLRLAPEDGAAPVRAAPGFMHFALSSVQQAPYWADRSLAMAKRVYEVAPYADVAVARGAAGLSGASRRIVELLER
ncbi:hypothetical protein [Pigmentiphaga sp.]|uniref:hypothetical protein n=1 Tax=Pigmentiphaga sp. TaxID=1977564 RepID=UPI0025F69936|nr:hypothetical protein [Pigmentiphaga sp.]